MFDLIIRSAKIYDGSGSPWYYGDLGIKGKEITEINPPKDAEAKETISAKDLAVCPGFIDIHCHSDMLLFPDPKEMSTGKLLGGVTTEVVGHCGSSIMPIAADKIEAYMNFIGRFLGPGAKWPKGWEPTYEKDGAWFTPKAIMNRISNRAMTKNCVTLIGHGNLRVAVMGLDQRRAESHEISAMANLLSECLDAGAAGFSTGLVFPPCSYSELEELRSMFAITASKGKVAHVHLRSESNEMLEALDDILKLAESTGVRLEVSHLRAMGFENWGKAQIGLEKIENARKRGVDVGCDMYPYTAGNAPIKMLLPPWCLGKSSDALQDCLSDTATQEKMKKDIAEGIEGWENFFTNAGWENLMISVTKVTSNIGKNIQALSLVYGDKDPTDTMLKLLLEDPNLWVTIFLFGEADIQKVLSSEISVICTDSLNDSHPRFAGTFTKVLSKKFRESIGMSLENAICKMTNTAAQRACIRDRGIILPGMKADLIVFDPETIKDMATYEGPRQEAIGIKYVIVNGEITVDHGKWTGKAVGKFLSV